MTGLAPERLLIDPNAMVIAEQDINEEENSSLRKSIGSTLSGTGAAVRRRIARAHQVKLAKDDARLRPYAQPVTPFLRDSISSKERVIIEGTQGFGLSLLHSPYYPFATGRDTTAAAFVSEAGLSPLDVDDVVLVLRAFPIRVGGNSGPLPNEIDWNTLTEECQSTRPLCELTSVTKSRRRIARFDSAIVKQAIITNSPTRIAINHLDYIDSFEATHEKVAQFLNELEMSLEQRIDYLGFGPSSLIKYTRFNLEVPSR
jgi:adenylosuccinate synthase